jgi:hypothetical protein
VSTETSKIVPQNEKARSIWRHQRALCEQVDSDSPEPWQPIVELLDQIDALRLALAASRDEADEQRKLANAALQDLQSSRDEAEKAKADTARLDWMQEHAASVEVNDEEVLRSTVQASDDFEATGHADPYDIRAAIDAAARADAARKEPPAKAHGCEVGE